MHDGYSDEWYIEHPLLMPVLFFDSVLSAAFSIALFMLASGIILTLIQ